MISTYLTQWIEHPEQLNKDTLYELRMQLARYPYSQTLRVLYLKNLFMLRDASFGDELRKSALYIADRSALFYIIEGNNYDLSSLRAAQESVEAAGDESADRTLTLINAFLATVPSEGLEPTSQVELDYSTDYTSLLLSDGDGTAATDGDPEADAPQLRGIELIDDFIEQSEQKMPAPLPIPEPAPEPPVAEASAPTAAPATAADDDSDEGCFTETLAKIYVKQHRYEKALEIIKKLSLKYPKKNAYFADQIRFLDKLIINSKSK
jgi:hypothetical protein